MKEEQEKHRKWRNDRAKELVKIKKQNMMKERQISKLKREYKRKEVLAQRKAEEVTALQKKEKMQRDKRLNAAKQRQKKANINMEQV